MPRHDSHENELSLLEHLEELRERLIKGLVALFICTLGAFFFVSHVLEFLNEPLMEAAAVPIHQESPALRLELRADGSLRLPQGAEAGLGALRPDAPMEIVREGETEPLYVWAPARHVGLQYIRPLDPLLIQFKAALIVGAALSFPFLIFQAWKFIMPGLLPAERRLAFPLLLSACILFPLGATFAYYMLEFMLGFAAQFAAENTLFFPDARAYLSFALTMMLAFGVVFELPLIVVLATRAGLVSTSAVARKRKHVFVIILIVAGIITPPDGLTMLIVTAPVYLLFEVSLIVSRALERAGARRGEQSTGPEEVPEVPED